MVAPYNNFSWALFIYKITYRRGVLLNKRFNRYDDSKAYREEDVPP
jgi:hypothetical protein